MGVNHNGFTYTDLFVAFSNIFSVIQDNSVAFSPQAKYTDWQPPLVDEI
jgi:hypothetical protein